MVISTRCGRRHRPRGRGRRPHALRDDHASGRGRRRLADCGDLAGLHGQLDRLRDSQNVFYAVRIDGEFDSVHTRSVHRPPRACPWWRRRPASGSSTCTMSAAPSSASGRRATSRRSSSRATTCISCPTTGGQGPTCSAARARAPRPRAAGSGLPRVLPRIGLVPPRRPDRRLRTSTGPKAKQQEKSDARVPPAALASAGQESGGPGVEYIFTIPGAKIDKVLDCLVDTKIKTVVCRHEQNAALIAQDRPHDRQGGGVPGDLRPGLYQPGDGAGDGGLEGDPVVALGGAVPLGDRLKLAHQSLDTVGLFRRSQVRRRDHHRTRDPRSGRRRPVRQRGGGPGRPSSPCRRT